MKEINMPELRDALGQEIKAGDFLVYGAAKGRCAGINVARVLSVEEAVEKYCKRKFLKMKIVGGDVTSWGKIRRNSKPSQIIFCSRVCVIPASIVPEEIKQLLSTP